MCLACRAGNCRRCSGECWCEITHDFDDSAWWHDDPRADYAADKQQDSRERNGGA